MGREMALRLRNGMKWNGMNRHFPERIREVTGRDNVTPENDIKSENNATSDNVTNISGIRRDGVTYWVHFPGRNWLEPYQFGVACARSRTPPHKVSPRDQWRI